MKQFVSGILLYFGLVLGVHAAVDLNTATQSELESVKGLGPAKARAIIEYRQKNGPFKSVADLDKVKGFGQASIKKLSGQLAVSVSTGKGETK